MRPSRCATAGGVDQPDGDGLAVAEVVGAGGLDGVGQGVAVVEDRPSAALALVGRHDLGLDPDALGDLFVERQVVEVLAARAGSGTSTSSPMPDRYVRAAGADRACRDRRARPGAARTRRRGSCPRAGSHRSCRRWPRRSCPAAWWARGPRDAPVVGRAANPAVSVTTPPPTAMTTSARVRPHVANEPAQHSHGGQRLGLLAVGDGEHPVVDAGIDVDADLTLGDDRGPLGRPRAAAPASSDEDALAHQDG